jgi:hypothetical protein
LEKLALSGERAAILSKKYTKFAENPCGGVTMVLIQLLLEEISMVNCKVQETAGLE